MKKSTKYLKITINILVMIFVLVFCIWILPRLIMYFMPFVVAAVIALIANPVVRFMEKKLKVNRKAGTAIIIVFVIALVVMVLYFTINWLIIELEGLIEIAPSLWESTSETIKKIVTDIQAALSRLPGPARGWADDFVNDLGSNVSGWLQNISNMTGEVEDAESSTNFGVIFIGTIMAIIASYLFVAERDYIDKTIRRYVPIGFRRRAELIITTMKGAVGAYFTAQFRIMGVVYVILVVGLLILGVKYSLLIGLIIALMDFLPFFGTGTVMLPWAVIKFVQQDYKMGFGLIVLWAISQAVRQFIQPKFVGDSMGLDPIPTIFLLYLGFRLGGAAGLIFAVPIGMIVINLYKAGVFSNFSYSIRLLFKDINKIRRFNNTELISEGIKITQLNNNFDDIPDEEEDEPPGENETDPE
ncbi:MAG: sporulation integral membrane protein YtvI [Lachnospiraceae bacterium]|nr:sporulation integral membrane protein YtvI [Lachnospiraceae bacterium]